jgi:hypothetical protein
MEFDPLPPRNCPLSGCVLLGRGGFEGGEGVRFNGSTHQRCNVAAKA